jgi:hypothetical protein
MESSHLKKVQTASSIRYLTISGLDARGILRTKNQGIRSFIIARRFGLVPEEGPLKPGLKTEYELARQRRKNIQGIVGGSLAFENSRCP